MVKALRSSRAMEEVALEGIASVVLATAAAVGVRWGACLRLAAASLLRRREQPRQVRAVLRRQSDSESAAAERHAHARAVVRHGRVGVVALPRQHQSGFTELEVRWEVRVQRAEFSAALLPLRAAAKTRIQRSCKVFAPSSGAPTSGSFSLEDCLSRACAHCSLFPSLLFPCLASPSLSMNLGGVGGGGSGGGLSLGGIGGMGGMSGMGGGGGGLSLQLGGDAFGARPQLARATSAPVVSTNVGGGGGGGGGSASWLRNAASMLKK